MSALRSFRRGRLRRVRSIGIVTVLIAAGLMWISAAQAVHDNGMFELDGNTVHNSATTPPYDWNSLFGSSGQRLITPDPVAGPLLADVFVSDAATPDPSYFSSDKDTYPIASGAQHWGCTTINNPTPKDDLLNAYAALVQVPANAPDNAGDQVLYLGSERGSNNGDSFAGFWLLKDPTVGCSGSGDFSGQHTDGDLLILSNYTNGGGTQDVTVFRWTGTDAGGSPVEVASLSGSTCSNSLSNDDACAIANTSAISTPWSPTSHDSQTFVEAGIDLTTLLGSGGGCFTNFMAETRSSQEITATLKDFAGGKFSTCVPPTIDTTATPGGDLNSAGVSNQHDVATISPATGRPDPTGTISFFLCNPSEVTAGGCESGGTQVGGAVTINAGSATSANASGSLTTATGKYCWRAEYTPDTAGSNFYVAASETNSDTECFTVVAPSLSITKTADASPVNAGDDIGFTIEVSNGGPGTAENATLSDPLPGGTATDWVIDPAYAGPGTCSITGQSGSQELDCSFGDLASGDSASVHISSSTDFANCTTYDNTATASADNSDDVQDSATIECLTPDLSVTKTADASPVTAGDEIGFTVDVTNNGPGTAYGATLADPLPGGTATDWVIDPAYAGPGTCSITGASGSQELDCSFGDLASGDSASVHISSSTDFANCTTYDNTATASASNAPDAEDSASIECQTPVLAITKTADSASVVAGDDIGFTVEVTNNGPGTATNVTLADPLPAGTAADWVIDPAYAGPGTCSITGPSGSQELDCSFGDMAVNDSASVHISSSTDFQDCTTYDNTATASADNAADVQDSASISCQTASLSITKTADASSVNAGDDIGFTVDVSSNGPGTAINATLSDPLPGGTATDWVIDPAYAGPGTCSITGPSGSQELDCSFGDLAPEDTASVHITSSTSAANCTVYDNTATASADDAADVQDSASITCNPADVSITKTADHSAPVLAGGQIGFTVEVANSGTGDATGVTLDDPLPAGSGTGVTWAIDPTVGTPAQFVLSGAAGSQTLSLVSSTLPADSDYTVHIVAVTSATECGTYDNTATLTTDNANNPDPASASESCRQPQIDLAVTKAGSPASQTLGDGNITWTMVVTNNGPDAATGVTIADPMPAGNAYVSATPSKGSCTGGTTLHCTIGNMAVGEKVTITLVTTPSTVGAQTNVVTVVGNEHETNTANNTATATVQTVGVITPPVTYCVAVSKVTPKQLFVGRKTKLTIHVTKHGQAVKGVHVRIKGPKINMRTKASNSKGVITARVKMKKAGIVIFSPIASKRCNTKRVGVTGVFTPPVTG